MNTPPRPSCNPDPTHLGSGIPCPPKGAQRPESGDRVWAASTEHPTISASVPNLAKLNREAPAQESTGRVDFDLAPLRAPGPRAETARFEATSTCNFGGLLRLAEPPVAPCWLVFQQGDLATGRLVRGDTSAAAAFAYAESVLDAGCTLLVVGGRGELSALDVSVSPERAIRVRSVEGPR